MGRKLGAMREILLIDIGSTYTKITAVDLAEESVVGRVQAVSTVDTDITVGINNAYSALLRQMGVSQLEPEKKLACSSAGGGLRMIAVGLVPRLTTKAAREAALGAGAKLVGCYSHKLVLADIGAIERAASDIILLTGGTDGGDTDTILHNARMLAQSSLSSTIIFAGNRVVAEESQRVLEAKGKKVYISENVMPEIDELNIEPACFLIRAIFVSEITHSKGLDKAEALVGPIRMPTPQAVLRAALLLSIGTRDIEGLGDLMVIDVGGATCDVHSVCKGEPSISGVVMKGLPEPFAKRTVEGDLGIRHNAHRIWEIATERHLLGDSFPQRCKVLLKQIDWEEKANYLSAHIDAIPKTEDDFFVDAVFARAAVDIAVGRHAGTIQAIHLPMGTVYLQYGKDLNCIKHIVGTGGIFSYGRMTRSILAAALSNGKEPFSLRPKRGELLVDDLYIMYAAGLLTEISPRKALCILKKHLRRLQGGA